MQTCRFSKLLGVSLLMLFGCAVHGRLCPRQWGCVRVRCTTKCIAHCTLCRASQCHSLKSSVAPRHVACPCSDNYVGGVGATVLANALAKNSSLRELYIKGNELGDTGVEALCKAFSGTVALLNAGISLDAVPNPYLASRARGKAGDTHELSSCEACTLRADITPAVPARRRARRRHARAGFGQQ